MRCKDGIEYFYGKRLFMKTRMSFLAIVCSLLVFPAAAQQKYKGTVVTKFGDQYKGQVTVNLAGENPDLISIETTSEAKSKSRRQKKQSVTNLSMKLNVALIKQVIINDTTYYFRDIKYNYNEKYHMNSCVRLVEGTLDCGYFQGGDPSSPDYIAVKLPNDEFSKLVSINFDYYKATLGWHIMAFGKCQSLREKMEQEKPGYTWTDSNTPQERLSMWRTWIREFNNCH